jgi:hypothetical protein
MYGGWRRDAACYLPYLASMYSQSQNLIIMGQILRVLIAIPVFNVAVCTCVI